MKKQLFFDLDRTLWDFEKNSKQALYELYETFNLGQYFEHFLQFYTKYVSINAELWLRLGQKKITKAELREGRFSKTLAYRGVVDAQLTKELSQFYISRSPFLTNLFPNTIETLIDLKNQGYEMHIITNGFPEVQHIKLKESKLIDYFNCIICSEDIGHTKPNKAIFEAALLKSGCKKEDAIMIGDDMRADIQGALLAGWNAVHFDPNKRFKKSSNIYRIRDLNELSLLLAVELK